jgi:hypothetical protein
MAAGRFGGQVEDVAVVADDRLGRATREPVGLTLAGDAP